MLTQRQLFLSHLAQTTPFPLMLEIEKAEGIYLYDKKGKKYADLISGISVSNLGHCHPKVIDAIKNQLDKYMHLMVYGEYIQSPQVQLASLLAKHLPASLSCTYFVNSGAEAIDGAMKLAKRYTGRSEIISFTNAYHGSTQGALSIMGSEIFKNAYRPLLPDVRTIEFNNEQQLSFITSNTAAVFVEPIQGEAGVVVPENNYLKKLRQRCTETGTVLVADEIQCGFGRMGTLFAFEQYHFIPDILCLAKAMGGGMPMGAFISSKEIMHSLTENPMLGHITTFGGHPVCCAAGYSALSVLLEENLIQQVSEKEKLFKQLLIHPSIKEVRGKGLLMAVQFDSFETNKKIIDLCIEKGVITDWFLFNDSAMRIAPPLIITEQEIKDCCAVILESINEIKRRERVN
jgi:acetylornithine/succinyldiaminopimelate/putrescine aminotransferase